MRKGVLTVRTAYMSTDSFIELVEDSETYIYIYDSLKRNSKSKTMHAYACYNILYIHIYVASQVIR